jgi:transposase
MRYIQGLNRNQTTLLPEILDDYITEDNPIRFIDAYINSLNLLELGFTYAEPKETGRKPYNPADLLKLYIYGYFNKIRSSRQLEKATYRNIELMWLMHKLHPDFKTIADFRKDNAKAIKLICRDFTLLCKKLNLFGCELIAIDGSKFSASNSNDKNYTKNKLVKLIEKIDNQIDSFMTDLDQGDQAEKNVKKPTTNELKEKIKKLRSHKKKYQQLQTQIEQSQGNQISFTDPDSRLMITSRGKDVAYNVQIVTDSKHKLIVTHEVTNKGNDQKQLSNMAIKAKNILDVDQLTAVADTGYWERNNIKKCHEENIKCYVPKPVRSHNKSLGLYTNKDFQYNSENDCFYCPAGQKLTYRGKRMKKESGHVEKIYQTHECYACNKKNECTRSKKPRCISRWIHENVIEQVDQRLGKEPEIIKLRKSLVEHPFGTIKHWMGHSFFLTRGIDNVSAEMSLSILIYNLKRVLNIVDFKELMATV